MSKFQQAIDQAIRANYVNAPTKPEEVKQSMVEGNSGTVDAYFLLQLTEVRSNLNQILSVDYTSRDGTAKASQGYVAVKGTLVLYPNENQAVIEVEILATQRLRRTRRYFWT